MMIAAARVILAFAGAITILLGVGLILTDGDRSAGLITILAGAAILLAVLYERTRYRSVDADRRNEAPGPGGGEPVGALAAGLPGHDRGLRRSDDRAPDAGLPPSGDRRPSLPGRGPRRLASGGRGDPSLTVPDGTDIRVVPEQRRARATLGRPARWAGMPRQLATRETPDR